MEDSRVRSPQWQHLLDYVKKTDYDGVSEDESEDSRSDMSDVDVDSKSAKPADIDSDAVDSDAVDYEESDDAPSDSDEDSGDKSDTSIKRKDLPEIRPFNHLQVSQERKRMPKVKSQPLNQRERRLQEVKTKVFLMKTMDNTHVRLVKILNTSYEIFTFICEKYEGAAFHGDPYFIQHYLMEIKNKAGSDLFLKLENAMKAASEAIESVMTAGQKSIYFFHSMPKSWKDDLRIWKGGRKYIPYEDLKQSIEGKGRDIQAQERYTLSKGTRESTATKNERDLMANGPPAPRTEYNNNLGCAASNFAFKGNSKRDRPYRNAKNRYRGHNGGNNNVKKDKSNNDGGRSGRNDNRDKSRGYDQRKKRG
ncbi:Hypothetical protein PHPALM_20358 [Phytophthora palmivora]|uniref:Uncharacterized protein n=1 Tax=Phytophthora palmivora TaxID=4796 RepID=A0A2P4XF23_9STRA|nr:Hypothetical protein PHPALM_20358 [Phytophthora palmivora]